MATQSNFRIKKGLTIGSTEVIDLNGELTASAFGTTADEHIEDVVGGLIVGGSNITATYDDGAGTLTLAADLAGDIEGVTAGDGLTGGGTSGTATLNVGAGTGISVAADTVSVDMTAFDTDDLSEGATNQYFTNERVDDRVNSLLTAGTGITLTYDDAANTLTVAGAAQYGDSDVLSYLSGGTYAGNIIPSTDNTYDLGSSSKTWRDVYVGPGSLYVNGQKVLEDSSGTIVVSADSDQNLQMKTAGSGDIEFNPSGTGIIQAKGTLQMLDGETITNSAGNAVEFGNNISVNQISSRSADTNLVLSGNGTGNVTLNDTVVITGDLTVSGTTTTVNSETINLADNILNLNSDFTSGTPTQDAGLSVSRGGSTAKTFLWDETNDRWTVGSETMVAATFLGDVTGDVTGNADTASTLATARTIGGVSFDGSANIDLPGVNTSGTQDTSGNAATATALETSRTIGLSGDVTGSGSFDGTGNLTIAATIAANSVALGTDTTGNFVGGISGTTNEIEVSGSGSENATVTIGLPNDVTISGTSTLTGKATTGFTTIGSSDGALRNTFIHSAAPTSGDGAVGDVWITYA